MQLGEKKNDCLSIKQGRKFDYTTFFTSITSLLCLIIIFQATDLYLQWYKENYKKELAPGVIADVPATAPTTTPAAQGTGQGGPDLTSDIAEARGKVDLLIGNRPPVQNPADPKAAANAFLSNFGSGISSRDEPPRDSHRR